MRTRFFIALFIQAILVSQVRAQGEPTQAELDFSASWLTNTTSTSSGDDVLIAAMFAQQNQPNRTADFLSLTLASPEHAKLRYSLIAYFCLFGAADSLCDDSSYVTQIIALDPDNLEPHLYSMLKLVDLRNTEAALLALIQGNSAPKMNNYYFDKLSLLRSRLARSGYPEGRVNGASEGLAGAGTMYALYSKLLSVCTERSSESAEWKAQCLTLGRRLELEGKTAIQNVFGFAIQRDSLGNSNIDEQERAAVLSRRDDFNAIRDKASQQLEWWSDTSLKTDELYRNMAELGEIQAVFQALEHDE